MGKFRTVFLFQLFSFLLINNLLNCGGDILSSYDFNKLRDAVTDAFTDDANMGHVVMARMMSFQERIRKERSSSSFPQPSLEEEDEDEVVLFEPPSDYYSFDEIYFDSGDVDRVALDNIVQTAVYHRDSTITDLDTIRLDNGQFVWFSTKNMITTWFYPSITKSDSKVHTFGLEGIQRLKPIVLKVQSNNGHRGQMLAVITLAATQDDQLKQTLSWYSWNEHENTLYQNGSIRLSGEGMDIRVFYIPVTDTHMLASMQINKIQMYIVSLDENGHLYLKSCTFIPITRAKDLESFSINGLLYVAVTNGRATTVWKHRAHEKDFVLHQRLGSVDVTDDIQYFRIGYEHFLGVVDVGGVAIYQWKGAIFVRIQTLRLPNEAVKWHSIVNEDEALLVLILKDQLLFFAWNKKLSQFVSSGHWHDQQWNFRMEVRAISYPGYDHGHHVLLVATDRTLIKFDVRLKRQRIATETKTDVFIDEANEIKNELDRQEAFLNQAYDLLKSLKSKLMEVSEVPKVTRLEPEQKLCNNLNSRLESIENSLHSTKASMASLSQQDLADTIHLKGKRTFRSLTVLDTADVRGDLKTDSLNGLNMSHFYEDSIMINKASHVSGLKTFTGRVVVQDGVKVTKRLNGQNPDDLIRLNRPQTVHDMTFLAPVTVQKNMDITGLVNGIDLSEEVILLRSDKTQTITDDSVFVDDIAVEDEVLVSGTVNGVKLSKLAADTVTSSGTQRITGNKKFAQMTVKGDVRAERVNGVDLKVLDSRIVRLDRPMIVNAPKTFLEDVVISDEGQLETKMVNGLRFPEDLVHFTEKRIVLSASKDFAGSVTVSGDLAIKGNLDGINLTDVMRTTGDQELCGNKTFAGSVHIAHMEQGMRNIPPVPFMNTVVIHGNLHVAHVINNVPLNDIVFRNETDLVFSRPVTFLNSQNLNGLVHINGRINGLHLEKDFLHRYSSNQIITGSKIFLKPVTVKGDLEVGHNLDGVDLHQLTKNVVSLSSVDPQFLSGRKSFVDGISVEDTLVLPWLASKNLFPNGLDIKRCNIKGNVTVDGYVNDVDFQELRANRMTLTTEQDIVAPIQIKGHVNIENLQIFGKMNGHNVSSFWNDVLWKNGAMNNQVITGRKQFTGEVDGAQLFTRHGLNGLSIPDIKKRTVQIVKGKIQSGNQYSFDGGIVVDGDLEMYGTINGIDLTKKVMDSVRRHSYVYPVIGVKVFDELHVKGDLSVGSTVNGLFLERDVLTATTPQNVIGQFILSKDARILNSVTMGSLKARTLHVHGDLLTDSLITNGNINGVNLQHLRRDAVLKGSGLQAIVGEKTFRGTVRFHKDMSIGHSVNGFNYAEHFKDIVVSDEQTQVVTGNKQFVADVDAPMGVRCQGPVSLSGSLNGVDVRDVLKRFERPYVVDKHVIIHGSLKISGDVKTLDTLNGLNMTRDVMTVSGNRIVSGSKTVKTMAVEGDIKSNSVNDWNLESLRRDTLTIDGDEKVTGRKTVKGTVTIHPSNISSALPRKSLKPAVQFRRQQLHFHGNVTFLNGVSRRRDPLSTEPHSCNSVNGCKTLAAINRAAAQKVSNVLFMDLVHTMNVTDISAVEVIQTSLTVMYLTGFSSCHKPMEVHVWNTAQKRFFLAGKTNVFSVIKMRTVYSSDNEPLLCILHRNCQTGRTTTSMYLVKDKGLVTKSTSQNHVDVVDFDMTFLGGSTDGLLMATLTKSSRVVVEKFFGSERKLLFVTDVPSSGDRVRWLLLSRGGPLLTIGSRRSDQTFLFQMSRSGSLQQVSTLQAYSLLSWTVDSGIGILVASQQATGSKNTTMVYKLEHNSAGLSMIEMEQLESEAGDILWTVENAFEKALQLNLLALNFRHKVTVYTKGLSGNYIRRSSMLLEDIHRAMPVFINRELLLITNNDRGWNAYLHHTNRQTDFNCVDGQRSDG